VIDWGDLISKEITECSTFVGIDWRLDVQVSTDSEKKTSNPIAFIDIESHDSDTNKLKTTTYQLNKQELLNLYDNFNKIKEQINLLVAE
jgi:HCaRG protein.